MKSETHPLDVALEHGLCGRFAEGEAALRTIESDARAQFNLGWYLCREGRWSEASMHLDTGRLLNCYGSPPLKNGRPVWNEFPLDGKTLHLRCEGGFGDEIIGVRWAQNFASLGARVHVSCSPGLASLFLRAPGVTAVTDCRGADYVQCDYWVPAMSAMRWFEPTGTPYLTTDPHRWARWSDVVDSPKMRVGIKWAGNPKFEGHQHRRFPVELMLDLVRLRPDVQFYSFQTGNDLVDLPPDVIDLDGKLTDWDETAAALAHMDLVITSCTGVAHCAAALGRPTWVVVPVLSYYPWSVPGSNTVWYDSVRLFRQTKFGDWQVPFQQIRLQLNDLRLEYDDKAFQQPSSDAVFNSIGGERSGETELLIQRLSGVIKSDDTVLDYGCGTGRVSKELIDRIGCEVIGFDNTGMLKSARAYVKSQKFLTEMKSVDVVTCIFVLQHAEHPSKIVDDVWNKLKPGGSFVTLDEGRRLATLSIPQDQFTSFRDDGMVLDEVVARKFDLVRQEDFPWRDSKIKLWRRRDVEPARSVA